MDIEKIVQSVVALGLRHICVTGGEPMLQQNCCLLLETLIKEGFVVTLETNGSIDLKKVPDFVYRIIDIKCPSSGMSQHNLRDILDNLRKNDEIKFVIANRDDYIFAYKITKENLAHFSGPIFFSPVVNKLKPAELANWIISDRIPARVHLQLHKILDIP